jgi:hypothetical protein
MVQIMEDKIMMKKLNDEALTNVTGGARRTGVMIHPATPAFIPSVVTDVLLCFTIFRTDELLIFHFALGTTFPDIDMVPSCPTNM